MAKKSILSTAKNRVFIEDKMNQLAEVLADARTQATTQSVIGPKIVGNDMLNQQGQTIGKFGSEKMADYVSSVLPDAIGEQRRIALQAVNAFRRSWNDNDVDQQKSLFSSFRIVAAMYLGDTEAAQIEAAFEDVVSLISLKAMMEAIRSGEGKTGYREIPDIDPTADDERNKITALSVQNFIKLANEDLDGREIHDMMVSSSEHWADHLESLGGEENITEAQRIRSKLPLCKKTVLIPNDIHRKVEFPKSF